MGDSTTKAHQQAANLVASVLLNEDADLYNWADEAARDDAIATLYALAKLSAQAVDAAARASGTTAEQALRVACDSAFGATPRLLGYDR